MKSMKYVVSAAAAAVAASALTAAPADASSVVHTGGHVACSMGGRYVQARSITITIDSGESHTVSTGSFNDVYRIDFTKMPKKGIGATVMIKCGSPTNLRGPYKTRTFFKPDWRNTTGDHNFYVALNGKVYTTKH